MRLGRLKSSTDQSASICLSVLVVQSPLWPLFHHNFFKNPRQLLSDRTPRLSFLKEKKTLCGYFEDLFSPPVLSHQRNKIQTLWKPSETPGEADVIVLF